MNILGWERDMKLIVARGSWFLLARLPEFDQLRGAIDGLRASIAGNSR